MYPGQRRVPKLVSNMIKKISHNISKLSLSPLQLSARIDKASSPPERKILDNFMNV